MSTYAKIWGYVRPHRLLLADAQRHALKAAGADPIFIESKDEGLEDVVNQVIQRGDTLAVYSLHVLAPPRKLTTDKPREKLWETVDRIDAKGVTILEVETGRTSKQPADLRAMIRDAIETMTSASRRANGRKSLGRPKIEFTEAEIELARIAWRSMDHRTNGDAIRASPEKWEYWRSMKMFGPSGRGK
jgi:hypothetical protein